MRYLIIGMSKQPFTSKKNGKKYLALSVTSKNLNYIGQQAKEIILGEDVLQSADIQTESGEIFVPDGKRYYADIDYNERGFIVSCSFTNG